MPTNKPKLSLTKQWVNRAIETNQNDLKFANKLHGDTGWFLRLSKREETLSGFTFSKN
jgi:hypothetical protein